MREDRHNRDRRNRRMAAGLAGLGVLMLGGALAAPLLYGAIGSATGIGGAVETVASPKPSGPSDRQMTVDFDANIDKALPWKVSVASAQTRPVGTLQQVSFVATNLSDRPTTARAVFNVTPQRAGRYFDIVHCFCSAPETLGPGETATLPLRFYVDPGIDRDDDLHTVQVITLSYTFYADHHRGS